MARPFLVAMRARNPWVRFREMFDGWKVRFIVRLRLFGVWVERRANVLEGRRGVKHAPVDQYAPPTPLPTSGLGS